MFMDFKKTPNNKKKITSLENTSKSRMHPHNACEQKVYLEQSRKLPPKSSENIP